MNYSVFQDWKTNRGNIKGRMILVFFRLAVVLRSHIVLTILFFPYLAFYRFFIEWVLGTEVQWGLKVGSGFRLEHGQSLLISGRSTIGKNCTVRQSTTIGNRRLKDGSLAVPIIGDNVDIGAHVCIIGDIVIGDNVIIGAGSVVVKDIPSNCTVFGNPAKVIEKREV